MNIKQLQVSKRIRIEEVANQKYNVFAAGIQGVRPPGPAFPGPGLGSGRYHPPGAFWGCQKEAGSVLLD
jgi:hypothetical protein